MIIDLPKRFFYTTETRFTSYSSYAVVQNGILNIKNTRGDLWYGELMREIAYALQKENTCFYCGKKLTKDKRTLDHMWPKSLGGITIPNNLVLCCENCNTEKDKMTVEQYRKFRSLSTKSEKIEFLEEVKEARNEMRMRREWAIPKEWISERNLKDILPDKKYIKRYKGAYDEKIEAFYQEYGYLSSPLTIDVTNHLMRGHAHFLFAQRKQLEKVPVIVLENVIFL